MVDVTPLLSLADVTVERGGARVLSGVSLRLMPGDRLAIAGDNGVGKTTLLRAMIGLERVAGGTLHHFGRAAANETDFRAARPRIGFLFQDSDDQLFCPTVVEDVAFGPLNQGLSARAARARAVETLEGLGLGNLADRVTHRLSGGEKRLVCLAGLIAMRPEVLLLDEPTNGLDAANAERLLGVIGELSAAMIVVSHDLEFLSRIATRAATLRGGTLVEGVLHRHPHVHDHLHIHVTRPPPPKRLL